MTSGTAGHRRDSPGTVPGSVAGRDGTHPYRGVPVSRLTYDPTHTEDCMTLEEKLKKVETLEELEGFANRRRYLPTLPRWTDEERGLILQRKYELEKLAARRK